MRRADTVKEMKLEMEDRTVMRASLTLALLALTISPAVVAADDAAKKKEEKWIQLFNGKDLKDWKVKITGYELGDNYKNTFRVEDGLLKVGYEGYEEFGGKFGHIFYDESFSNYRLRAEYRFVGDQVPGGPGWAYRNSGLMLHGQAPETMTKDQKFPASIEVQLLGGGEKGERSTVNLCTPGTHVVMNGKLHTPHCTKSRSKTYRGDQWVTVEVEVFGNRIRHIVEGEVVLEYTDPQLDGRDADARRLLEAGADIPLKRGTISLQSESHPIEFRKVELLELPDPGPWVDLLEKNDLSRHWEKSAGNWKIDDTGVVTLVPRPGERGWSRFDAYLWTKEQYKDFEIEFEYKVEKGGNSGFYFHVGDKTSPVAKGIEVQILDRRKEGSGLNDHTSGGIIPGIPPTKAAAKPAGEWNRFDITCLGNDLTVRLNGVTVNAVKLDHPKIKTRPKTGPIGFQDHALPLALRKIRIRKL